MAETKNEQQGQLSLPYEDVTGLVAGRPTIRKDERIRDANVSSYKIALKYIEPRPGFNPRQKFNGIPELAESLLQDGQEEALKVVILKDGRILFYEGDRRYRAHAGEDAAIAGRLSFRPDRRLDARRDRLGDRRHFLPRPHRARALGGAGAATGGASLI